MNKLKIYGVTIVGVSTLLLGGTLLPNSFLAANFLPALAQENSNEFKAKPLVEATSEEIAQAAVSFTRARFSILSGTPEVVLNRPVTVESLPSLGLPKIGFAAQDPPLRLVILKGDFDISNLGISLPKSNWHWRVGYLAYVMDLNAGLPTLITGSPRGGAFRQALNDPSLPDDLPAVPRSVLPDLRNTADAIPEPPIVTPANKPPYGSLAPGIPENMIKKPNLPEVR